MMKKIKENKVIFGVIGGILLVGIIAVVILAVKANQNVKPQDKVASGPAIQATPTVDPNAGKTFSTLTGEPVSPEVQAKRPFAIMINNIYYANQNQKGTSQADIIYEALAEGGITRMMAVYQDPSKVKAIGSVRSARHYYVSFASEWNAIFCHFGHTHYALSKIEQLKMENLSGLSNIGEVVYHRESGYKPPHNVYTSGAKMIEGAKKMKYSLTQDTSKVAEHFNFNEKDTDLSSADAKGASSVLLPFSTYSTVSFAYNADKKVYEKSEYKKKHMDQASNTQLAFKNVIIQLVEESNIDHNGYQTMKIHAKRGKGFYCTDGKMIPIEWTKGELERKMRYETLDHQLLTINPGKTYIAAFPTSEQGNIKIK